MRKLKAWSVGWYLPIERERRKAEGVLSIIEANTEKIYPTVYPSPASQERLYKLRDKQGYVVVFKDRSGNIVFSFSNLDLLKKILRKVKSRATIYEDSIDLNKWIKSSQGVSLDLMKVEFE